MKKYGGNTFGLKDINAASYISLLGLDPDTLTATPSIRSAVRSDVQSGGLHSLTYRAKKNKDDGYSVKIDHWVKYPDGTDHTTNVVRLKSVMEKDGHYTLTRAALFGQHVTYRDETHFFQFLSQLREILREIRHHHVPALKTLIELQKTFLPDRMHHLPGIDATGQASFHGRQAANGKDKKPFSVPHYILPALLGYHSDAPNDEKPVVMKLASGNLKETYQPVFSKVKIRKSDKSLSLAVKAWKQDKAGVAEKKSKTTWFKLDFKKDPHDNKMMVLESAYCCGKRIKKRDSVNLVRLCRATANATHQIRTKEAIPSFQRLLQDNGLHEVVNKLPAKYDRKQNGLEGHGRMTFNVLGGNNVQDVKFNESRIGANGYLYTYETEGQEKPEAILVDMGNLFLKRDLHGYDGAFLNPEGMLPHKDPGHLEPRVNIRALLCTHAHEDHVGALPHLIKSGYVLPKIICSDITKAFILDKLTRLEIPKTDWPIFKVVAPYQRCQTGPFRLRAMPMSHSSPALAFRIATKAGAVLHLGDWKTDPTVRVGYPTDMAALGRMRVDAVVSDSTSVFREGKAVQESVIENNFVDFFEKNIDKRPIVSMLGSNLNRLLTVLRAGARVGKTPVIVGHSLDTTRRILNKIGFTDAETGEHTTLKEYLANKFDITMMTANSKTAKALLKSGSTDALIVATGTHNEELSTTDKLLRWMHRDIELQPHQDIVLRSQRAIPGSEADYDHFRKRATEQGITVIDPGSPEANGLDLYASGHGHREELVEMIRAVKAEYIIPVHGDQNQLQEHEALVTAHGKMPVTVNNQNILEIKKGQAPAVIGNRIESWAYYEHQRPASQYYGGAMRYDVGLANPLLSGKWKHLMNVTDSLVSYDQPDEEDYHMPTVAIQPSLPDTQTSSRHAGAGIDTVWQNNYGNITFYDCETTSLRYGEITQFAAIKVDKEGAVSETNIRQKIDDKTLPSPMACLVTNMSPYTLIDDAGMDREHFAANLYRHFTDGSNAKNKLLSVGHNNINADDQWIRHTLHKNGYVRNMVTNGYHVRRADTLQMSRAAYLYSPGAIEVPIVDERPSFRLGNLAMQNGLVKDTEQAHDALFDVKMTQSLFNLILEKSPEVSREMLARCDSKANQKWLLGDGKGIQYRPLVTYASNVMGRLTPFMGMLVNIDLDHSYGRKAIMMNLKEDPHDFDKMDAQDVLDLLRDKNQKKIQLLNLHKQPIVLPAEYGFNVNAHDNMEVQLLTERQENVLRHPKRNMVIRKAVDMYLKENRREVDPYYIEDYLYAHPETHFERQALNDDGKIMNSVTPSKSPMAEDILAALSMVKHPYTKRVLEERLYASYADHLPSHIKESMDAKSRMALRAPANSPKMTLKQYWKEIAEVQQSKDIWIQSDQDKQKILDDLISFGKNFEMMHTHNRLTDEYEAGVSLRKRLT